MNKVKDHIKSILLIVALLTTFSGVSWKVWGMDNNIQKNTDYRLQEQYDRTLERLDYLVVECGERAGDCGARQQENYRRWTIRQKDLEKKLGY